MRILSDISYTVEIVVSTGAMISCKEDEENRICHYYKGSIQNRQYAKHGNILSHYACIHFLILIHYSIICYVFLMLHICRLHWVLLLFNTLLYCISHVELYCNALNSSSPPSVQYIILQLVFLISETNYSWCSYSLLVLNTTCNTNSMSINM